MSERDDSVFKFLISDRRTHKYVTMCFCYAQTHLGHSDDFISSFEDAHERPVTDAEKRVLREFAQKYGDFMHFVFPNTRKQIDIILKVVEIAAKELEYLPFKICKVKLSRGLSSTIKQATDLPTTQFHTKQ